MATMDTNEKPNKAKEAGHDSDVAARLCKCDAEDTETDSSRGYEVFAKGNIR